MEWENKAIPSHYLSHRYRTELLESERTPSSSFKTQKSPKHPNGFRQSRQGSVSCMFRREDLCIAAWHWGTGRALPEGDESVFDTNIEILEEKSHFKHHGNLLLIRDNLSLSPRRYAEALKPYQNGRTSATI